MFNFENSSVGWGLLVHLSFNMWTDRPLVDDPIRQGVIDSPHLQETMLFDDDVWAEALHRAAAAGVRTIVMDLGDAVAYESHPEIALPDAWSVGKLRDELGRVRDLGMTPVPKLNFSTCHDAWLHQWSRQVSTPAYYRVAQDLIAEVCQLFDGPELFHIGMDEEGFELQRRFDLVTIRQNELWWHDLDLLCTAVRNGGARPWMWADKAWSDPGLYERIDRDVVLSNWYYDLDFAVDVDGPAPEMDYPTAARTYVDLERAGLDQVPGASNWRFDSNLDQTARYCRENVDSTRLLGMLHTTWRPTIRAFQDRIFGAIDQIAAVANA